MKDRKTTKEKLLECACTVFAENGYHSTTIAEISEKAKANIAAVNYHFNNKENLYRRVITHAIEIADEYVPLDKGIDATATPEEKLLSFIRGILTRSIGDKPHNNLKKIMAAEMASPTEEAGTLVAEYTKSIRAHLLSIIIELSKDKLAEEHHFFCLYSIMSQCLFLTYNKKGREKNIDKNFNELLQVEQLTNHIYTFSLAGIRQHHIPMESPND